MTLAAINKLYLNQEDSQIKGGKMSFKRLSDLLNNKASVALDSRNEDLQESLAMFEIRALDLKTVQMNQISFVA